MEASPCRWYPLLLADDWEDRTEDDDRRRHRSRIPVPSSFTVDDGMSGQSKKRENAVVEWLIGTKTQTQRYKLHGHGHEKGVYAGDDKL